MSNIRMLSKKLNQKEETDADVEVSWADQQKINAFSKLTAKIDYLEEQHEKLKGVVIAVVVVSLPVLIPVLHIPLIQQEKEYLDDVSMELELADEDEPVRYKVGDTFAHMPACDAIERVAKDTELMQLELDSLQSEMETVQGKMTELKASLYAKFGNAINLEKE
ncbi:Prefoldin subunit 4 [Spinellus fusiger]|nr:Prefoldin subunit 4 [Spinellus fusiger]